LAVWAAAAAVCSGCGSAHPQARDGGLSAAKPFSGVYALPQVKVVFRRFGITVEGAPRPPFYLGNLDGPGIRNESIGAVYFVIFRSAPVARSYLASRRGSEELRGWVGEAAQRIVRRNVVFFIPARRSRVVKRRVLNAVAGL
jgi:hypothetical protein